VLQRLLQQQRKSSAVLTVRNHAARKETKIQFVKGFETLGCIEFLEYYFKIIKKGAFGALFYEITPKPCTIQFICEICVVPLQYGWTKVLDELFLC